MKSSDKTQEQLHDEKIMSRREAIKGGFALTAGAIATMMAARSGSAAVTPMDVKRSSFTTHAVTPMDVREK